LKRDVIKKVEIDALGRLNISPEEQKFTQICRIATQVHWDPQNQNLYSPKPTDWTYVDWYNHIIKVAHEECFC
jgi:Integron Cassette Protein Hfx_Cass5